MWNKARLEINDSLKYAVPLEIHTPPVLDINLKGQLSHNFPICEISKRRLYVSV